MAQLTSKIPAIEAPQEAAEAASDGRGGAGEGRASPRYGRVSGGRAEALVAEVVRGMTQEDSAAARYCRNCGHELRPEHRFCPDCGEPAHETAHVPTPETGVEVPPPPSQVGGTDQQRRQWRWSGTFERSIGVGLGGCLGIIVAVFLASFCTAHVIGGG